MTNNSIIGNTQQAATDATGARQATKAAWRQSPLTHLGIGITLLIVGYLLLNGINWNFFLMIVIGAVLYKGNQSLTAWMGSSLAWKWPYILKGLGVGIIVLALAQSGFFGLMSKAVNYVEYEARVAADMAPPAPTPAQAVQTMTWHANQTYVLGTDAVMRGAIPQAGVIFDQPNRYCVQAKSESAPDITPILTGAGLNQTNPWSQTLVRPGVGDTEGVISIRVAPTAQCK